MCIACAAAADHYGHQADVENVYTSRGPPSVPRIGSQSAQRHAGSQSARPPPTSTGRLHSGTRLRGCTAGRSRAGIDLPLSATRSDTALACHRPKQQPGRRLCCLLCACAARSSCCRALCVQGGVLCRLLTTRSRRCRGCCRRRPAALPVRRRRGAWLVRRRLVALQVLRRLVFLVVRRRPA